MTGDRGSIFDITPRLDEHLAVFPGDTPLTREVVLDLARGDAVTLSTLRSTSHLGAHVDAPSHYDPDGVSIAERALEPFLGPCVVLRVHPGPGGLVTESMVREALPTAVPGASESLREIRRVLLATGTFPDPTEFRTDFAALDPELIDWLAARDVTLVGIDTPSIDPARSKELPAHAAVCRHDMNILEGVVLEAVPPGVYELIALPLRLAEFDGSPVRAVLRSLGSPASATMPRFGLHPRQG